jgi:hypothetical protein
MKRPARPREWDEFEKLQPGGRDIRRGGRSDPAHVIGGLPSGTTSYRVPAKKCRKTLMRICMTIS